MTSTLWNAGKGGTHRATTAARSSVCRTSTPSAPALPVPPGMSLPRSDVLLRPTRVTDIQEDFLHFRSLRDVYKSLHIRTNVQAHEHLMTLDSKIHLHWKGPRRIGGSVIAELYVYPKENSVICIIQIDEYPSARMTEKTTLDELTSESHAALP